MLGCVALYTKTSCFSLDFESIFFAKIHRPQISIYFFAPWQETTKGLNQRFTSILALGSWFLYYSHLNKSYFITFLKLQYNFGD